MAMSAMSTSALSSLEAMLHSLMRGSGAGGDDNTPADDTLSSPPPPPLPARPTARGRHPSRRRARPAAGPRTSPSSSSLSPPKEREDARADDVSRLVEELERKAMEVEARLRHKEEENAALKRRMESYHIRWLEYEIRIKSLEEAFHEQMAALHLAQDAARMADEAAYCDRREPSESHVNTSEEPPVIRLWHGRDRMSSVGARRRVVSRLGAEFRGQSHTLERGAAALVAEAPPSAGSVDDLKKLKAQFRAWTKDYKARLRRTKAELGRDRQRRQGSCWI
ncbi:hypothetical protein BAE44_0001588 [Dichanthelium oligosanthes]|uniref:Uncharacterized protein n=1 Tax=Dichanthelium oligosanthes TaxID=888268 RepID=A0A1E5WJ41_9POAL|nr:hypothetical protein BAE44_0001588 [Dichanthelium oligosanthes]